MTVSTRQLIATGLMIVALVLFVIDSVTNGWTTLGTVAIVCFAVAIGAEVAAMLRHHDRLSGR